MSRRRRQLYLVELDGRTFVAEARNQHELLQGLRLSHPSGRIWVRRVKRVRCRQCDQQPCVC